MEFNLTFRGILMEVQLSNVNKFLWRISHKAPLESAHKKKISNLSFD